MSEATNETHGPAIGQSMGESIYREFNDRVSYDGLLHAACDVAGMPDPRELTLLNERNASLLATVSSLAERRVDVVEDDSSMTLDLARLDAKLNAVIELVNRLALPSAALPPRVSMRFNAIGAELPLGHLPEPGAHVLLRIHFDACRALPLELPGLVVAPPTGGMGLVVFEGLGELVREAIEKLAFRQHRRQIAESRQTARPI
jgi:Atypical PilZ domain, cyclic di-GMP receptor